MITAPLPKSKISAGTRDFPVAWSGGCAPFVVEVQVKGDVIQRHEGLTGPVFLVRSLEIGALEYSVVVRDDRQNSAQASLSGAATRPQMPAKLRTGRRPLDLIGEAIWLQRNAGREWYLEAASLLQPLVEERNELAREVARTLSSKDARP